MKIKNPKILLITVIFLISSILLFKHYFLLVPNLSSSLPQYLFLVIKGDVPTTRDQFFVAYVPGNKYYSKRPFIKMVGGLPGDQIKIIDREFYINDQFIGFAKFHSLKGDPLARAEIAGLIPEHKFFAYTLHRDSYDSRYQEIGLIDEKNIIGTAIAIF